MPRRDAMRHRCPCAARRTGAPRRRTDRCGATPPTPWRYGLTHPSRRGPPAAPFAPGPMAAWALPWPPFRHPIDPATHHTPEPAHPRPFRAPPRHLRAAANPWWAAAALRRRAVQRGPRGVGLPAAPWSCVSGASLSGAENLGHRVRAPRENAGRWARPRGPLRRAVGAREGSGLTSERVSSMLMSLDLQGQVTSAPGGLYIPASLLNREPR